MNHDSTIQTLKHCLTELRKSTEHGPHSHAIVRDVYIKALIVLCEDLLLRTLARNDSPIEAAIERAQIKSEQEMEDE